MRRSGEQELVHLGARRGEIFCSERQPHIAIPVNAVTQSEVLFFRPYCGSFPSLVGVICATRILIGWMGLMATSDSSLI